MKKIAVLNLLIVFITLLYGQDMSYSKPGWNFYQELPDPSTADLSIWSVLKNDVYVSFVSDNVRYPKSNVPDVPVLTSWNGTSWKGERIHTQILVWTKKDIPGLTIDVKDLTGTKGNRISKKDIKASFVRYVMTDELGRGCDHRKSTDYDSSLVEDPIDIIDVIPVKANTVQPVWLSIQVPSGIPAGKYTGTMTVNASKKYELNISVEVLNHILPPPSQWKYDLDLWQYPAPIARIHDVKLWSDEHFKLMRPYYTALANAGQKVITTNIIDQPWGNTHVYFDDPTLISWVRKKDGSWSFDYTLFDRYVSFVMSCGITRRINCYTMVTWDMSFTYFDESTGKKESIKAKPGSREYTDFWSPMLKDFTKHLKAKGWFDITSIAMDERPLESMRAVIDLLKQVDPGWKIALAADSYHPEIGNDIYDYSIASYLKYEDDLLIKRKAEGKPTTYYTACKEKFNGAYTFSPPAENTWLGWHSAAKGYTGYLFWAYNTWVKSPLLDSRFRSWPAGTCYQFYPGPRSSIRFEKLIEGIQDFENIRILKEQFFKEGNKECLRELEETLSWFDFSKLETDTADEMVVRAKTLINKY